LETFEKFNPVHQLEQLAGFTNPRWLELNHGWDQKSLPDLRAANVHWFDQPMSLDITAPILWLINQEFTRRGIAPGWRGVQRFVRRGPLPPRSAIPSTPRRLGDVAKKNLMMRWIDLQWLRALLGPDHKTEYRRWQSVFSADHHIAITAFAKVNVLVSHGASIPGPHPAYHVLKQLSVPKRARIGLAGLIDSDAGDRRRVTENRLRDSYRPGVESLMKRDTYALTTEEAERRVLYCEAIELAAGSPTDAAIFFGWITGEQITRQTMHEMRKKLADQCGFKTRAWRAASSR
jgi:hypothetical protein